MGKRSTKENKNIYQICREEANLTRERASERMEYISADRIEKIESEKSYPHPDEILAMEDCYKNPTLRNYYCSHECPIGQISVPKLELKNLSQIVLEMLASLNAMDKDKNRLIEITADGELTADEYHDFAVIEDQLNKISLASESLKIWLQQTIMDGNIDSEELNKARSLI